MSALKVTVNAAALGSRHECCSVSIQQCDAHEMRVPKSLATESQQVIDFFGSVSERLRSQNRHFDDAVVNHCIRLISEHAEHTLRELANGTSSHDAGRV